MRDALLRLLCAWGLALFAITELLGAFDALRRLPLLVCWMVAAVVIFAGFIRVRFVRKGASIPNGFAKPLRDPVVALCLGGIAAIQVATAMAAIASPPNSADAMAYHMPRVVYWAEQASIRFFPTAYLNQISLQPLTEYVILHTYVLSGGDRLVNLVQWFASLASVIAVSALAREFGATARGQAISALFCATLPSGILAASGAKNDYFLAMWLATALYFAARFATMRRWDDVFFLATGLGLALLTKATAYLFAPWLLIAVVLPILRGIRKQTLARLAAAGVVVLLINTPHYLRNFQLSGAPLGFDSAHGDGFFRWRNETFGWKQTASNALRNISEQLGGRSDRWNQRVFSAVVRVHTRLGININDPDTTWRWSTFEPPRNANHEANGNSRQHLVILTILGAISIGLALRGRHVRVAVYVLALLCGFLAFCWYLKWQPFETRLFLPLLVAGSVITGPALEIVLNAVPKPFAMGSVLLQVGLCLFLVSVARRPAIENWVRPLKGPASVFRVPRDQQYFSDMNQWEVRPEYERIIDLVTASGCRTIGIDSFDFQLEYPLMALLRERQPEVQFAHTGVENPSTRFPPPVKESPCVVVCLYCSGDSRRQKLYSSFPSAVTVTRSIVFEDPRR